MGKQWAKRFNAGTGMGIEVPVELRFIGNNQYLEKCKNKAGRTRKPVSH